MVLIIDARIAWPTKIMMPSFDFLRQFAAGC